MLHNKTPKQGAKAFTMQVLPSREHLIGAISMDGFCRPDKCWHYVAINAIAEHWNPGARHYVKVDAGHIKINYRGWRYTADTPKHVKHSLMLFDKRKYEQVQVRSYTLKFRRGTKIVKVSAERQAQIEAARQERIKAGTETYVRLPHSLRKRVEGFSGLV